MARPFMFPAHAGMNRLWALLPMFPLNVPRTRGDEPCIRSIYALALAMFPAHAGMNRAGLNPRQPYLNVPRTRGDEPDIMPEIRPYHPCSPHTRG